MDFSKLNGLIPAVIQDDGTNEVLMVGFMNGEALRRTRETGYVTFFSRTRSALWTKGETSGNRLRVCTLLTDCDDDTLLVRVVREGEGRVCHRGTVTCFTAIAAGSSPLEAGSSPLEAGSSPLEAGSSPLEAGSSTLEAGSSDPAY